MKDLTTLEGRLKAIEEIEISLLESFKKNKITLSENAVCRIQNNNVEIGIKEPDEKKVRKMQCASEITIYARITNQSFGNKDNEINFGSSGVFTPNDESPYWRTIHAANILQNWGKACEIVNVHCKFYDELEKEIFALKATTNEEATA